ncbi:MAG: flagellar biosynthesis protein FlhB [Micavibrio sp.]|nr:MAG: flagellar biosynthesis protein FlhB [Micavibrio sp.]
MSEENDNTDDSQKTEEPSRKKLEDARRRGQVVLSREVNNWVMLFTGALIVAMLSPYLLGSMKDTLRIFIAEPHLLPADPNGFLLLSEGLAREILSIWFLPLLLLFIAAILGPFVQIGPLFSAESMKPKLSKISIISGAKRLFSARSLMEFVKGVLKLSIISIVGVAVLYPAYPTIERMIYLEFSNVLEEIYFLLLRLLAAVIAVLTVVAVIDYIFQRADFMKKMRMSRQELKEEYKQTEGDPQVRARLRELRETRARQRMMAAVPEADVVITNPDHYAVALKYDQQNMNAPVMLAKGTDDVAERIKAVARENNVPVVENPPLARALHGAMDIGEMIPPEHYQAVAEVISYVFKLKNNRASAS